MIVEARHKPTEFAELRSDFRFAQSESDPRRGQFGRRYYSAVFRERFQDLSFVIVSSEKPILLVSCSVMDQVIGDFDMPIEFTAATNLDSGVYHSAITTALGHLIKLGQDNSAVELRIEEWTKESAMTPLGSALFNAGASVNSTFRALIDLECEEVEITRNLRRRYKSFINWGRRNIRLEYLNQHNPNRILLQSFRQLHRKVAGFTTRSDETWEVQFEQIVAGKGELIVGYLENGTCVSGALTIDGASRALYTSAAYDHEHFDKPLGHWTVLSAILNARRRGMKWFDLGEIPTKPNVDKRGFNVGHFKKGFAPAPQLHLVWSLPISQ